MSAPIELLPEPSFDHLVFAGDLPAFARPEPSLRPQRRPTSSPAAGEETRGFFRWLCAQRGLDADAYRDSILRRREAACLRAVRARTLAQAREAVERRPEDVDRAIGALLIGVTAFFRDPGVFRSIQALLPGLQRDRRTLRVLSVGCSDGSELLSVGILLGAAGALTGSSLTGIDCRPAAVRAARAGAYPLESVAAVPAPLRSRWFHLHAREARVREELASACDFRVGDAFDVQLESAGIDLILCRNLAIYLELSAARRLWRRLQEALRPGGLLVTGKAERPDGAGELALAGPCIYRRDP